MALLTSVLAGKWAAACLFLYHYLVCLIYGFGTLVVALTTIREHQRHCELLEKLRVEYIANSYLGCGEGGFDKSEGRVLAKDVAVQVKEVLVNPRYTVSSS
jgi:SMC interacting uncharacterized protein involved in chromosome segregation